MPEDLSVKELRLQLTDIHSYVDDFLCGNCTTLSRHILSHHSVDSPQIDNLLTCSTACLSQSALQTIEAKLLRLLLTRLSSVLRALIASTSSSPFADTADGETPPPISQLVLQALDIVRTAQERPLTGLRPRTAFRPVDAHVNDNIPVISQSRPTSRLSNPDDDGHPYQQGKRSESTSPPPRSTSSRLSSRKFHPMQNSLRSRTRTISRRSSTSTITLPYGEEESGSVRSKIKELEEEIDSLKKNELLLLTYPDPYGPCSTRPSGDAILDMRMQIMANKLRIQLLEKQSRQLSNVLQERKKSSSSHSWDEYSLPSISMTSHSSFGNTGLSAEADLMSYDYGMNHAMAEKEETVTARSSLSSASTKTAGTGDSGGRQCRRMRSSLLGVKCDQTRTRGGGGGDVTVIKSGRETPGKKEEASHSTANTLALKTSRLMTSRIVSAHKKPAAIVPLPRFR
ncbi:hypothetical protein RvY_13506 [Ramazzottius varieornatus]|uniref:Uncharacterized protein n=1 Tax=Ramazzottius varieornatus TaxID=947166 RepID=A0A1D1VQA3_RAMVA|nr:hypothetical protein RvY_13506 [Ramazzottius varieornatus]